MLHSCPIPPSRLYTEKREIAAREALRLGVIRVTRSVSEEEGKVKKFFENSGKQEIVEETIHLTLDALNAKCDVLVSRARDVEEMK
jgi:hypothetical protein